MRTVRPGCLQLGGVKVCRHITDRERSWSTCLNGRDNVRKVFLSGPFSDEFCEIVVPLCSDDVGFELVRFGFRAFCARRLELADTKLGERPVII